MRLHIVCQRRCHGLACGGVVWRAATICLDTRSEWFSTQRHVDYSDLKEGMSKLNARKSTYPSVVAWRMASTTNLTGYPDNCVHRELTIGHASKVGGDK